MKGSILILLLVFTTCVFGQEQKATKPQIAIFGFGMSLSLESIEKMKAEEVGIASTGSTLIDFRGRLNLFKYFNLDAGFYVSQFKDKLPFTQAVVFTSGQLSGLPSSGKSEIVSGGIYYSVGGTVPLTKQLHLNAGVGRRNYSATRKITSCSNCMKRELDLEAGNYLRGGLSWLSVEGQGKEQGEVDLLYTHYFDGGFESTITLGFFVYF